MMYQECIMVKLKKKLAFVKKNGGKVRLLVDMTDPKTTPFVKRFNATETKNWKTTIQRKMVATK